VHGDLDLAGARHPVAFRLAAGADGRLTGSARLRQTDWGMKPYSTLFGTLKVSDEVEVAIDARVPAA
jgi:polyisoprenoid-binding protein YceI